MTRATHVLTASGPKSNNSVPKQPFCSIHLFNSLFLIFPIFKFQTRISHLCNFTDHFFPAFDSLMENDMNMERISLIDVSSEDDCLIASTSRDSWFLQSSGIADSFDVNDCFGLFEPNIAHEGENIVKFTMQGEQPPMSFGPSEPNRAGKDGKCNLRKSLAWDTAFFTSEGVLDPEELGIVNKTFKAENRALPGIQEDMRKSAESSSTLCSDSWALESLEVDLFEHKRTSIQKSSDECSEVSIVAYSSNKSELEEPDIQSLGSSKKLDLASRSKMKPVAISKRLGTSKEGFVKTTEALSCPRAVAIRSGEPKPSLKPPRNLSKANPPFIESTKRPSLGSVSIRTRNNTAKTANVVSQHSAVVSKRLISGDSSSGSRPSPKSSYSTSPYSMKMLATNSCSSYNRSVNSSSDSTGPSPYKTTRNTVNSRNFDLSSSGSTVKIPARISKNKTKSGNAPPSAYLMTMSKFSSNISPASSLDGLSSESSSSTSTMNQKLNNSKASLDISSPSSICRGVSSDSDAPQPLVLQNDSHDQPYVERKSSVIGSISRCVPKGSLATRVVSSSAAVTTSASRSCINSNSRAQGFKPSGLRMPSPKIGFFDAGKSGVRISNGCLQSHSQLQGGLLKNASGIGNTIGISKPKHSKLQSTVPLAQNGTPKFNPHHTGSPHLCSASSMRSNSLQIQQPSTPSPKVSATLRTKENQPGMCVKVQKDLSSQTGKERLLKTSKIEVEVPKTAKIGQCYETNAEEHELKPQITNEASCSCNHESIKLSHTMDEETALEQSSVPQRRYGHTENNLQSHAGSNEKENLFPSEDQLDVLNRHMEIALNKDMVKEPTGNKKGSNPSNFNVNNSDQSGDLKSSKDFQQVLVHAQEVEFLQSSSKLSSLNVSLVNAELKTNQHQNSFGI